MVFAPWAFLSQELSRKESLMTINNTALRTSTPLAAIEESTLLEMYRTMRLARALDERMWLLNRAGKVAFVISCQGHEAAQVGSAMALSAGKDFVLPYYRGLGTVLTIGMTPREVMLALFARAEDPNSGGRQMPSHYSQRSRRIVNQSSVVGTQIVHAAGIALAERMKGGDAIAWTSFGEGTTSQGDFHEGLNLASAQKLPVIFQCENNGYAISVPSSSQMAVQRVAERGVAYNMPGLSIDGTDPVAMYLATREAVQRARQGQGPTLIEACCIRLTPHSSDDNDRVYRPSEELKTLRDRDPLVTFRQRLLQSGVLDETKERELEQEIAHLVDDATDYAEQAPSPEPHTLYDHVYGVAA
jgi:2-oxoisovalerate dehydrogenase E1 component alpha subunit